MGGTVLNTVRGAASQSGFMNRIFTQGANGLSPAQITAELRALLKLAGVNLPQSVMIGLDGAQAILAGGVLVSDVLEGAKVLQCVGDLSLSLGGVANLLSDCGLIDNQLGDFLGLAANLALAISSAGTNILADIGVVVSVIQCAFDVSKDMFGSSQAAQMQAKAALQKAVMNYLSPQIQKASTLISQYNAGKLNSFDLIGQLALQSPAEFASFYPGLATYFPSWTQVNLSGSGNSSGWFKTNTATDTATFFQLVTTKQQVESVLINEFIVKPMEPFESFKTVAPVISLNALSVLAMLMASSPKGDIVFGFDINLIGMMRALQITPAMLGDDWLFKGLQRNENDIADWASHLPYEPLTLPYAKPATEGGVVINGIVQSTPQEAAQNAQAEALTTLQTQMQALDENGDIEGLLAIPEAVAMLQNYAKLHVEPVFYDIDQANADLGDYTLKLNTLNVQLSKASADMTDAFEQSQVTQIKNEIKALVKPTTPVGEIINMKLFGQSITSQSWYKPGCSTDPANAQGKQFWDYVHQNYALDFSDYWKCLNVLDTMKKSNLLSNEEELLDKFGNIQTIENLYESAFQFVQFKQMNLAARAQLAQNLGIPVDQLATRTDSKGNLIFYRKVAA